MAMYCVNSGYGDTHGRNKSVLAEVRSIFTPKRL